MSTASTLASGHATRRVPGRRARGCRDRAPHTALLDAMRARRLDDDLLADLRDTVLRDGRLEPRDMGFTTAYCHTPDGLRAEVAGAGFAVVTLYGVEGAGWLLFEKKGGVPEGADDAPDDEALLADAVRAARAIETEPALLGVSSHVLAVARAPGESR